jgi:hypothetical protein
MPSAIDVTKPAEGEAYTADVRANFATAAAEISALQDAVGSTASGTMVLGTPPDAITISVGAGAPGPTTPGFDQPGSQYTNITDGTLHLSVGDGTWTAVT